MKARPILIAIAAVVVAGSIAIAAQPRPAATQKPITPTAAAVTCQPAPTVLKKRALELAETQRDSERLLAALDEEVGYTSVDESDTGLAITIHYSDELLIALFSPYQSFRFDLREALRKREPLVPLTVPTNVHITVSPSQIGSPDIEKIIVERNGKPVQPIANNMKPTVMTTRLGAKAVLHSGSVHYPCSAFAPGARVTVTAIPASGSNFDKAFGSRALASITGLKYTASQAVVSDDFVGLSLDDVRSVLGEPAKIDSARWTYTTQTNFDVVFYSSDRVVTEATPRYVPREQIGKQ